ncbi:GerMN domain-containing protein [Paenibacillus filicis]|uniref:GerMN domain-containing protein n=1 Tax=Paenibacillus filicis TaxID=669464 RepID=A0ABU9DEZ5_9BACL
MHTHWIKITAAAVVFALIASGCGQKPAAQPLTSPPSEPVKTTEPIKTGSSDTTSQTPPLTQQPQKQSKVIKVFYSDANLENLVEKEAKIEFGEEKDKYAAAFNALKKAPDDQTESLAKHLIFKKAELKDGQLTLDLVMPDAARLGASGEEMLLTALQKTAFQFAEVKTLEVLLEGKKVDSLMGHMELQHPFKR